MTSDVMAGRVVRAEFRGKAGKALSPREFEILAALSTGKRAKQVAHVLGVSEQTIKNHLGAAYAKLEVAGLVEAYHRLGWLNLDRVDVSIDEATRRIETLRIELRDLTAWLDRVEDRLLEPEARP